MLIVECILQVLGVPSSTLIQNNFRWLMAWGVVRCERPCQRKRVYRELEWLTAWGVARCERPCWERECTEESSGDSWPEVWWGVRGWEALVRKSVQRRVQVTHGLRCGEVWEALPEEESIQQEGGAQVSSQAELGDPRDVIGAWLFLQAALHHVPAQETLQWLVKMMSSLFTMYQPRKPCNDWWKWCHHSSLCTSPGNPAMIGENDVITLHYLPAQETLQWLVKIPWNDWWKRFHHSSPCTHPGYPATIGENDVITLHHVPAQETLQLLAKTMSSLFTIFQPRKAGGKQCHITLLVCILLLL